MTEWPDVRRSRSSPIARTRRPDALSASAGGGEGVGLPPNLVPPQKPARSSRLGCDSGGDSGRSWQRRVEGVSRPLPLRSEQPSDDATVVLRAGVMSPDNVRRVAPRSGPLTSTRCTGSRSRVCSTRRCKRHAVVNGSSATDRCDCRHSVESVAPASRCWRPLTARTSLWCWLISACSPSHASTTASTTPSRIRAKRRAGGL